MAIDEQNKEKDAIAQMRKEFSANVSHELKTKLTSISGYAEIMMNGMVKVEDMPTFSERIYKEARRLITLVEDIIKLSRLDEESVELEKQDVNLYELTREICTRLTRRQEKGVHVESLVKCKRITESDRFSMRCFSTSVKMQSKQQGKWICKKSGLEHSGWTKM